MFIQDAFLIGDRRSFIVSEPMVSPDLLGIMS